MEGFLLDNKGDVVIADGRIKMTSNKDLTVQKIRQVLLTNNGEWWLNTNEGIDRYSLLCKNPNKDVIEDNIKRGLWQVDPTFKITDFSCTQNKNERSLLVTFTAVNDDGEEITLTL